MQLKYRLLRLDMDTQEQGDEAILEKAQENNKIATDTIEKFFK